MTTAAEISWDDLKRMIFAHSEQLRETDRLIRELRESGKETDRRMQETDRRMQETDRRMQETDRRMQETDRRLQEAVENMRESDRRFDERMRRLERQLGQLGNRLGQFVQDMVEPAVVRLFQERGIPVHQVFANAVARDDDGRAIMEIDLLVVDGEHAVAVECKSRLTTADIDEHLERLAAFKRAFPRFSDVILHGAVAAMGAPEEAIRYAERQGLYVLVQADDDIVLKNRPDFEPKSW